MLALKQARRGCRERAFPFDDSPGARASIIGLPPDPATGARRRKTIRCKDNGKGELMIERDKVLRQLDERGTSPPTVA